MLALCYLSKCDHLTGWDGFCVPVCFCSTHQNIHFWLNSHLFHWPCVKLCPLQVHLIMFHVWLAWVKIFIFKVTQQLSVLQVWCICKWDLIAISNPDTMAALQVISHTVGVGHTEWVIKLRISQANISKWLEHLFHYCIRQTFLSSPSLFFLSGCCQLSHLD